MRKTWFEKMRDKPGYPKILTLQEGFPCYNALHKMGVEVGEDIVIVNPSEVVPLMAEVLCGKLTTLGEICSTIAKKHAVKGCCTLVTGIQIMTIGNAVEECKLNGDTSLLVDVPWWRTLKMDGFLNEKHPGGQETQKALLEAEGFKVVSRGKRYQVVDVDENLFRWS